MLLVNLRNRQVNACVSFCQDFYIVVVFHLKLQREWLATCRLGRNLQILHIHVVLYRQRSVRLQPVSACEFLRHFLQLRVPSLRVREAFVHIAQIWYFVIQLVEVEACVNAQRALVGYGVAREHIVERGSSVPVIRCRVVGRCGDKAKHRYCAKWSTISGVERLVIAPRCTQMLYALPHGVAPVAVAVGEELLVNLPHWFKYMSSGVAVKRHVQRLGEVPRQSELAVPQEILAHRHRQLHVNASLVARLLLVVIARNVAVEAYRCRQPVEFPVFYEFQVLVLALHQLAERLKRLRIWHPVILETPPVVIRVLIHVVGVGVMLLVK